MNKTGKSNSESRNFPFSDDLSMHLVDRQFRLEKQNLIKILFYKKLIGDYIELNLNQSYQKRFNLDQMMVVSIPFCLFCLFNIL